MKVKEIIADQSVWMPNPKYDQVKPLVTVILPTYSRGKNGLFRQSVDSVLNQSFRRLELIIIDDGSVDGTFDISKWYMRRDPRVNIIRHKKNMGLPAISTYEAYMKARGEYIAYAFDDNQWELDALAKTFDFMEENGVKASYGITKIKDPDTGSIVEFGTDGRLVNAMLPFNNCIGAGSVVLHRDVLETVGLHDPHLSLTRVCDWDLWNRIIDRYDFVATGIQFTFEHGTTQKDSLGNVYKLDQWFFREWQQSRNTELLAPPKYGDFDVIGYNSQNSVHFGNCLLEHYRQYSGKHWFSVQEQNLIEGTEFSRKRKNIMLLVAEVNASFMSFLRHKGDDCTVFFCRGDGFLVTELARTDVAVFGRLFWENTPNLTLIKSLNIPCYYFVDDNFREIAREPCDASIIGLAKLTNRENLKKFAGIIVSSNRLKEYFTSNRLHNNVILLDPIYEDACQAGRDEKAFTVGFMGGLFRMDTLTKCVIPALKKLARDIPVRLLCPCLPGEEDKIEELGEGIIEVIPVERTANYNFLLSKYANAGVDVLVYCGHNTRNNLFKTKNGLLNAVSLGAPLLASDIEPYCYKETDEPEGVYVLVKNNQEEWYNKLKMLSDSPEMRDEIFKSAHKWCMERYSSQRAWESMDRELDKYPFHDTLYTVHQFEKICVWLLKRPSGVYPSSPGPAFRPYIPENLSCSNEMKLPRRFGFTSGVTSIREIGLLFAVFGECTGEVIVRIYRKNETEPAVERSVPVERLTKDGYTSLYLGQTVEVRTDELLYLELDVEYDKKDGYVAVFEDRTRRTFLYKVFNKLGHPIPGKNALFIDCRS